jgi:hypothetical protein
MLVQEGPSLSLRSDNDVNQLSTQTTSMCTLVYLNVHTGVHQCAHWCTSMCTLVYVNRSHEMYSAAQQAMAALRPRGCNIEEGTVSTSGAQHQHHSLWLGPNALAPRATLSVPPTKTFLCQELLVQPCLNCQAKGYLRVHHDDAHLYGSESQLL